MSDIQPRVAGSSQEIYNYPENTHVAHLGIGGEMFMLWAYHIKTAKSCFYNSTNGWYRVLAHVIILI